MAAAPPHASITKFVASSNHGGAARRTRPAGHTLLTLLSHSDGRESILRSAQYSVRLLVHLRGSRSAGKQRRLLEAVALLSAIRRIVGLGDLLVALRGDGLWPDVPPSSPVGKGEGSSKDRDASWVSKVDLESAFHVMRGLLSSLATTFDFLYLLAILKLLPVRLPPRGVRALDSVADAATLLGAGLGVAQATHSRAMIRKEARALRASLRGQESPRLPLTPLVEKPNALDLDLSPPPVPTREVLKVHRALRSLRAERRALSWERVRLLCEGIFAACDYWEYDGKGRRWTGGEGIRAWTGWVGAVIGLGQEWGEAR